MQKVPSIDPTLNDAIYTSDLVVIVVDSSSGMDSLQPLVQSLLPRAPQLIVVENIFSDASPDRGQSLTQSQLSSLVKGLNPPLPMLIQISTPQAAKALEALRNSLGNSNFADTPDFHSAYLDSGLGNLIEQISTQLESTPNLILQSATTTLIQSASSALISSLYHQSILEESRNDISKLASQTEAIRRQAQDELYFDSNRGGIQMSTVDSKNRISEVITSRLSWWKLPLGRVDDIGPIMKGLVEISFLKDFETRVRPFLLVIYGLSHAA